MLLDFVVGLVLGCEKVEIEFVEVEKVYELIVVLGDEDVMMDDVERFGDLYECFVHFEIFFSEY